MNKENRPLVINKPVKVENHQFEVQIFMKTSNRLRGIYRIYLKPIKKKPNNHDM